MDEIDYENCIVTFVDILGFREMIDGSHPAEVHHALSRLVRATEPLELKDKREMQLIHDTGMTNPTFSQSVSDAILRVTIVEREKQAGHGSVRNDALFFELHELMGSQVDLVQQDTFVRGGVTIGDVCIDRSERTSIFGPGMIRAYEIESQEAVFPRLVVDDRLLDQYTKGNLMLSQDGPDEEATAEIRSLVRTGEDGVVFVDYVRGAHQCFGTFSDYLDFLHMHGDKVLRNIKTYSERPRVRRKYVWLARYHNETIDWWCREAEKNGRFIDDYQAAGVSEPNRQLVAAKVQIPGEWG